MCAREMALDALQQVVARAGHAAAEDDALRVADAAGVRQCLTQIVKHLLERFDREGVAAAGGVEHVLAGKVPHRAQAGRLGRFGKAFFRHADDAVRRGILLDAAALAARCRGPCPAH